MALLPQNVQLKAADKDDPYSGISDFLSMSFENNPDISAIGPLKISQVPQAEISQSISAGTNASVVYSANFEIDLHGARRDDIHTWSITSSDGAITFRHDANLNRQHDLPGTFTLNQDCPIIIHEAQIQIPGDPPIRFSGLNAILPAGASVSFGQATQPLSNAA